MKNYRKILSVLMALILALSVIAVPLSASAAVSDPAAVGGYIPDRPQGKVDPAYPDFEYTVTNGEAKIVDYNFNGGEVTFPSKLGGYTVTSIGGNVFYTCAPRITGVVIPDTVKTIDRMAFYYCNNMTNVVIPESVTSIGDMAFSYCQSLTSVKIPSSVTTIGTMTFIECTALEEVMFPSALKEIGLKAFNQCKALKKLELPDSVTTIGEQAFCSCPSLEKIFIPASVTEIGSEAFVLGTDAFPKFDDTSGNKIEVPQDKRDSIIVDPANKVYDSRDNCNAIIETATNTLLAGCSKTVIPDSVTAIDNRAFSGCTGLKQVELPAGLNSIGDSAFIGCTGLTSVVIPDQVTAIPGEAFRGCSALTSVTLPENLNRIGWFAFYCCDSLKSVTIPASVEYIGDEALGYHRDYVQSPYDNTLELKSVIINDFSIYGYTGTAAETYARENGIPFERLDGTDDNEFEYTVSSGKATITAYNGTSGKMIIPGMIGGYPVVAVADGAFENCKTMRNVEIPSTVKTIGKKAFAGCSNLNEVVIPDSVTEIGDSAFAKCSKLSSVSLPDSLKTVGESAFIECDSLKSVTVPASVESIGDRAFGLNWLGEYQNKFDKENRFVLYGYYGTEAQRYAQTCMDNNGEYVPFIGVEPAQSENVEVVELPDGLYCSVVDKNGAYDESLEIPDGRKVIASYDIAIWDSNHRTVNYVEDKVKVKILCNDPKVELYTPRFWGLSDYFFKTYEDGWMVIEIDEPGEVIVAGRPAPPYGDYDGDGEVSIFDVTRIQGYDIGMDVDMDETALKRCDVNRDSEVNVIDATYIQRYLADMGIPYPVGKICL